MHIKQRFSRHRNHPVALIMEPKRCSDACIDMKDKRNGDSMEHSKKAISSYSVISEIECPVCAEYMHPPIKMCNSGHSLCARCFNLVRSCPTCRTSLCNLARNYTLEKLHNKLKFPCRFQVDGCDEIQFGTDIMSHEQICLFKNRNCPLKVIDNCKWNGRAKDMATHCKKAHPTNIFFKASQKLTCSNFLNKHLNRRNYFYIIFNVYGKYFKCAWDINYETGFMRWCVFLISEPDRGFQYGYEIEFQGQRKGNNISMKTKCPQLLDDDDDDVFNNSHFIFTHYDMVKNYCKGNDFLYNVKILKKHA